jgi:hypothetical protein
MASEVRVKTEACIGASRDAEFAQLSLANGNANGHDLFSPVVTEPTPES